MEGVYFESFVAMWVIAASIKVLPIFRNIELILMI